MQKEFNITGTCIPAMHYMVNISAKLQSVMQLIEKGKYFTVNRPRQYGKTTVLSHLEKLLNKNSDYLVSSISFEGIGEIMFKDEIAFSPFVLKKIAYGFFKNEEIQNYLLEASKKVNNLDTLFMETSAFVRKYNNRKVVLMIDEVDKSTNNQLFLSFLGMLRNKYLSRNDGKDFTFHSVILAGVHDIKTLKLKLRPDEEQKFNSPWNIAADFKVDMSFNPAEIATMLTDYANDKGVKMDIPAIADKLFFYTSGYPFFVSKLCKVIDEDVLPQKAAAAAVKKKAESEQSWTVDDVDESFRLTLKDSNTNFDSLGANIENNPDLYELTKRIIIDGDDISYTSTVPAISLAVLYGIIREENGKCKVHNKIYAQLLYDHMMMRIVLENKTPRISNYNFVDNYITKDKGLDVEKLLQKFQKFMKEQYSAKDMEFLEANGRLVFLAFLKPIVNGNGFDFKEVQISEERRLDIVITFLNHKYIVELKVWRGEKYHKQGVLQLCSYLEMQNVRKGYLIIFNNVRKKHWKQQRLTVKGKKVFAVWV